MPVDKSVVILKALADPTRLELVRDLARKPIGSGSCGELTAESDLSQPAMSHHFAKLVQAGIITEQKQGVRKFYRLNRQLLKRSGIDIAKL